MHKNRERTAHPSLVQTLSLIACNFPDFHNILFSHVSVCVCMINCIELNMFDFREIVQHRGSHCKIVSHKTSCMQLILSCVPGLKKITVNHQCQIGFAGVP